MAAADDIVHSTASMSGGCLRSDVKFTKRFGDATRPNTGSLLLLRKQPRDIFRREA